MYPKFIFSFLLMIGVVSFINAQSVTYTNFFVLDQIETDQTLLLGDPKRTDPIGTTPNVNYAATRTVTAGLVYGKEALKDIADNQWQFRVEFELYEEGESTPFDNATVTIKHGNTNGIYESVEKFNTTTGAVELKILSVEASTNNFGTIETDPAVIESIVPEDVRLELKMDVERYDYLDPTNSPQVAFETNSAQHNVLLKWSFVAGATHYEVEYAYLDNEVIITPTLDEIFTRATRIETASQHVNIPVTFPEGKLYFRVRGVGRYIRNVNNDYTNIKYTDWIDGNGLTDYPIGIKPVGVASPMEIETFEADRNWQYTTSFAEDGKYKKVMTYFDDGLKNRQVITNLSTEESVLVATSHYDVEGRPTVSILPAPNLLPAENNLFFKPNFNLGYNRDNFDKTTSNGTGDADALGNTNGAGAYYSPANGDNGIYKDYIDNAEGYPLTHMRYLNDGTGRVAAQSGVGDFYQLGTGRETQYFYDDPSSTQLHRLFGKNVGAAKYYKRQLVKDANGQFSVSYIDLAGQVIATALSGASPDNVEALDSEVNGTYNIIEDLMDNNVINLEEGTSCVITSVMHESTQAETYTFNYDLTGITSLFNVVEEDGTQHSICSHCEYMVEFSISDPCGEIVLINGNEVYAPTVTGPSCFGMTAENDITFSVSFNQIGTYKVSKKLKVIPKTLEDYFSIIENTANLYPDLVLPDIDYENCGETCEQHYMAEWMEMNFSPLNLATDQTVAEWFAANPTEADDLSTYVDTEMDNDPTCGLTSGFIDTLLTTGAQGECDALLAQLIQQVSPGGCLFEFSDTDGDGIQDVNNLWWDELPNSGNINDVVTTLGITVVDITDAANWQEGWGEVLATIHPEYCRKIICDELIPSREFDLKLRLTKTYAEAAVEFSLNSSANLEDYMTEVFEADFAYTDLGIDFQSAIENYASINEDYDCNHNGDYTEGESPDIDNDNNISISELTDCHFQGSEEVKWRQMVAFYFGVKQEAVQNYIDNYSPSCTQIDANTYPELAGCTIFLDNLGIYEVGDGITDESVMIMEGEDWITDNVGTSLCDCEAKVQGWINAIEGSTSGIPCSATFPMVGANYNNLLNYCESNCDPNNGSYNPDNPFGYIILDDFNDSNSPLFALPTCVQDILIEDVAVAYDDVYEQQISPCFLEVLGAFNDPTFNCPTFSSPYLSEESICYERINISDTNDNQIIACFAENTSSFFCGNLAQRSFTSACGNCLNFSFFEYNTSWSAIDACDVQGLSNVRMVPSPNLNATPSDGAKTYHNSSTQDLVAVDLLVNGTIISGYALFLDDCDNPCISTLIGIPNEITVNLQDNFFSCVDDLIAEAYLLGEQAQQESVNVLLEQFLAQTNCLGSGFSETFSVEHATTEHHYTLYYYDQAGNLVQTVPPAGVDPLPTSAFNSNGVWNGTSEPNHTMETQYTYNTLGQVVWQQTPDGGETTFQYDFAQRLRLSQNDKQKDDAGPPDDYFSYTRYDEQGRIAEVGQLEGYTPSVADLNDIYFPDGTNGSLTQWTRTFYDGDEPDPNVSNFNPSHLRGRVSKTENEYIESFYDYDAHGNVKELLHKIPGLGNKKIRYEYDLISGNVNEVAYQPDAMDCFIHRYCYDADNRITEVWTSEDGVLWENDARYFYYKHGPLARMEIGNDKVQGMDYYYTLQGWIKGVGMPGDDASQEPGQDGHLGDNFNEFFAKDQMAYVLGYHDEDYTPIGVPYNHQPWTDLGADVLSKDGHKGLFNGNIAWMTTDLQHFGATDGLRTMAYKYDALHRIKAARSYGWNGTNWINTTTSDDADYAYDPNGNLLTLDRSSTAFGALMDDLSYDYEEDANNDPLNRLKSVTETLPVSTPSDLGDFKGTHEYTYDAIGNLIKDEVTSGNTTHSINDIDWTVYGKVSSVDNANGDDTEYTYDAAGNRLTREKVNTTPGIEKIFYVRDASGNVMSIYELETDNDNTIAFGDLMQKEVSLYGSSRLGLRKFYESRQMPVGPGGMTEVPMPYERTRGNRQYELSNHLGNVLTTISDKKTGVAGADPTIAETYTANVLMASDYYPFGLQMPGRKFNEPDYRYGFNGKENSEDSEWGEQLVQDYGFRLYNPGIGKFLSVDPLFKEFPWNSCYSFAENRVIQGIDLDGSEFELRIFSPEISRKLSNAILLGNIVEQRRLVYYALMNQFPDEWAAQLSESYVHKRENNAGKLAYSDEYESGLTVYLYNFIDKSSNITDNPDLSEKIITTDKIHFSSNNSYGPKDKYFPVDLNLMNTNYEFDGGDEYYGKNDLLGWFGGIDLSIAGGGSGKGVITGRLRGYGYLEFNYHNWTSGAGGASFSYGPIIGEYLGPDSSPENPLGSLGFFLGDGETNALTGEWNSKDSNGNIMWQGEAPSIGFSIGGALLNVYQRALTKLKAEFLESDGQYSTIRWEKLEKDIKD